jgi:hypothetical protein
VFALYDSIYRIAFRFGCHDLVAERVVKYSVLMNSRLMV